MAPRKRRRVPATVNGHRQNCAENLTNGTPSVGGFLRTNASPKASVRYPFKRQREHEQAISNPKSNRNAEDTVSKDPKLNGRLVPTVSLESSTDSPIFRRRKGPPETKSSIHSLKLNDEGPNRALRTRNRPPNTLKASNHHGSPKMFKLPPMEMCRVKPRESLSCLNMLAPVFADCKLNGAVAPRVVLKRLDIDTILQNGVTSLGPRKTRSSPNLPSSRDLKPRTKSRVRFKGVGTSRNLKTPRAPGVSGTGRTRTSRGSRKRRRGFEPVPVHEKKWWNSFPLKHVAVRLTKLPL